jgi:hypothetical protein
MDSVNIEGCPRTVEYCFLKNPLPLTMTVLGGKAIAELMVISDTFGHQFLRHDQVAVLHRLSALDHDLWLCLEKVNIGVLVFGGLLSPHALTQGVQLEVVQLGDRLGGVPWKRSAHGVIELGQEVPVTVDLRAFVVDDLSHETPVNAP